MCCSLLLSLKISQHSHLSPSKIPSLFASYSLALLPAPSALVAACQPTLSSSQVARHSTFHHARRRRACSEYKFGETAVGANASANFLANYCVAPRPKTPYRPLNTPHRTRHHPTYPGVHASHQLSTRIAFLPTNMPTVSVWYDID